MNSLCKEPFLYKAHDLIAFEIFYLNKLFLRMTKEMTPFVLTQFWLIVISCFSHE
jgi:hypothetical protein